MILETNKFGLIKIGEKQLVVKFKGATDVPIMLGNGTKHVVVIQVEDESYDYFLDMADTMSASLTEINGKRYVGIVSKFKRIKSRLGTRRANVTLDCEKI